MEADKSAVGCVKYGRAADVSGVSEGHRRYYKLLKREVGCNGWVVGGAFDDAREHALADVDV